MTDNITNIRSRAKAYETFRTPAHAYEVLFDYRPEWFDGCGCDPSAGDGRMFAELDRRGHGGPWYLNDVREEELPRLASVPNAVATIGDYLALANPPEADFMLTNPPFSRSVEFVDKARTHISGPICILQSIAWQGTQRRSEWLRKSGLAWVLNLSKRPRWEMDDGGKAPSNIWDFAWYVFLPGHRGLPRMDWLSSSKAA